jgi:hypothetical protein
VSSTRTASRSSASVWCEPRQLLLFDLDDAERELAGLPPEILARVLGREVDGHAALIAGREPERRLVHLGEHAALPDLEPVSLLGPRLPAFRLDRVVDDDVIPGLDGPGDGHQGRLALGQVLERRLDVGVGHFDRYVGDAEAAVLAERDRRLDLDDGGEAERLPFFELEVLDLRVLHRGQLGLVHGATVDGRDELLGHGPPDLAGEVRAHQRAGHLAPAESR